MTAFGGPLALAALYAPASVAGASAGAGLAMALFAVPLVIWLRYAKNGRPRRLASRNHYS